MDKSQVFLDEKENLKLVFSAVDLLIDTIKQRAKNAEQALNEFIDIDPRYKELKPHADEIINAYRSIKQDYSLLDRLVDIKNDRPYIGKVMLQGENEPWYFGKHGDFFVVPLVNGVKIADWRSKSYTVYVMSQEKVPVEVEWESETKPSTKEIFTNKDTVIAHISMDIQKGVLVDFPVFLDATGVGSRDQFVEMIKKILSVNARLGDLQDIVSTISKEEYLIVDYPLEKNLFITGGAGSGKTQIALHRISKKIYDSNLKREDIVFYSPNRFLLKSIANVLPSLGDSNIPNMTFDMLLEKNIIPVLKTSKRTFESSADVLRQYYTVATFDQRDFAIRKFKNSLAFLTFLDDKIDALMDDVHFFSDLSLPRYLKKEKLEQFFDAAFFEGLGESEVLSSVVDKIIQFSGLVYDEERRNRLERSLLMTYMNNKKLLRWYRQMASDPRLSELEKKGFSFSGTFFPTNLNEDLIDVSFYELNMMLLSLSTEKRESKDKVESILDAICKKFFVNPDDDKVVSAIRNKLNDLLNKGAQISNNLEAIKACKKEFAFFADFSYSERHVSKKWLNEEFEAMYNQNSNTQQKRTVDKNEKILDTLANRIYSLDKATPVNEIRDRLNGIYFTRNTRITELYEAFLGDLDNASKDSFSAKGTDFAYEDIIALQYLYFELFGYPRYKQKLVVVDEAQDYNPIQMKILSKSYNNAKFNFFGDPNQNINPYIEGGMSEEVKSFFPGGLEERTLTVLYRSSGEIIEFGDKILGTSISKSIRGKTGVDVQRRNVNKKDLGVTLVQDLTAFTNKEYQSIGIITKTIDEAKETEKLLLAGDLPQDIKDSIEILDQPGENFEQRQFKKIVILPSYTSKGLEFDGTLVVINKANQFYKKDLKMLYTICTRARHELIVYNSDNLLQPFAETLDKLS